MSFATRILDGIVSGDLVAPPPPMIETLRLPPIEGWEPGRVWGDWKVDPSTFHGGGAVFGGYVAALADSFLSLAMFSTMEDDEIFTTSDLRVSFFRPIVSGTISIVAEVLNRGRRMAHVECVFVHENGKVVAKATATEVILKVSERDDSGSGG